MLHPLLIENVLSGGFSIYHESFRRFVLATLKDKKVDIERNVYGILADWLKSKSYFEFDKSFYYLTELQYKLGRDAENVSLIEKEFVLKSVSEGYSRKRIRMNLNCIVRSAGRIQNLSFYKSLKDWTWMIKKCQKFICYCIFIHMNGGVH